MKRTIRCNNKGFTIMEVMIAMALVMIVASFAATALASGQRSTIKTVDISKGGDVALSECENYLAGSESGKTDGDYQLKKESGGLNGFPDIKLEVKDTADNSNGVRYVAFKRDGEEHSDDEVAEGGGGMLDTDEEDATEAPTEAPTQAPTEAVTEPTTEAPTEASTEAPTEASTEDDSTGTYDDFVTFGHEYKECDWDKNKYITEDGYTYIDEAGNTIITGYNLVDKSDFNSHAIKLENGEGFNLRYIKPGNTSITNYKIQFYITGNGGKETTFVANGVTYTGNTFEVDGNCGWISIAAPADGRILLKGYRIIPC